jgi:hypothetical protein
MFFHQWIGRTAEQAENVLCGSAIFSLLQQYVRSTTTTFAA